MNPKGNFANYLVDTTSTLRPIHQVLRLEEPDPRLRDVEILLRFLSFKAFGQDYTGNLKRFLDDSMRRFSMQWDKNKAPIETAVHEFYQATSRAIQIFGEQHVGRKYSGKWESRFNKSLFEAELYYIEQVRDASLNGAANHRFVEGIKFLCEHDALFRSSIESTTKTNANYVARFDAIRKLTNEAYGMNITDIPVTA